MILCIYLYVFSYSAVYYQFVLFVNFVHVFAHSSMGFFWGFFCFFFLLICKGSPREHCDKRIAIWSHCLGIVQCDNRTHTQSLDI